MGKRLLDFKLGISDIEQFNPLFSTCKVRVLYTGKNRNMSSISKEAVEKALPTLKNIPIIGEFSEEIKDYKGHGGKIDIEANRFIHTTKAYGVVPESATYEWEDVTSRDGIVREYLTISGCYLWTSRYEEAYSIVEQGKGQSMEIEVTNGKWVEEEDTYQIDNFVFSALCILGDDTEPAFEDANITSYSLDKGSFKQEFSIMLDELKTSLSQEKEEEKMLKALLEKYSLTVEDLTAKGIKFNEISEEDLEAKIIEVFELKDPVDPVDPVSTKVDPVKTDGFEARIEALEGELNTANATVTTLTGEVTTLTGEVETLREFKLNIEKESHAEKVKEMFTNFQLTDEDVKDIDIHALSIEDIEEKCYSIVGKKLTSTKGFSINGGIHLPINKTSEVPTKSANDYTEYYK